jgi:hypothetical protein
MTLVLENGVRWAVNRLSDAVCMTRDDVPPGCDCVSATSVSDEEVRAKSCEEIEC